MKKLLLLGFILGMTACQEVPQERLDSLKETISDFETDVKSDIPTEVQAIKDSFAVVESLIEAEKGKTFGNYRVANLKMEIIENQISTLSYMLIEKENQLKALIDSYVQEAGTSLYVWTALYKKKNMNALTKEWKDDVQKQINLWPLLVEIKQTKNIDKKLEIIKSKLEYAKELNAKMRPYLSEEEYNECIMKRDEAKASQKIKRGF